MTVSRTEKSKGFEEPVLLCMSETLNTGINWEKTLSDAFLYYSGYV